LLGRNAAASLCLFSFSSCILSSSLGLLPPEFIVTTSAVIQVFWDIAFELWIARDRYETATDVSIAIGDPSFHNAIAQKGFIDRRGHFDP
jgi:hypothetical protein